MRKGLCGPFRRQAAWPCVGFVPSPAFSVAPSVSGVGLLPVGFLGSFLPPVGLVLVRRVLEAWKAPEEQFGDWFIGLGLNDPGRFLPALDRALEAIVGDRDWVFER
jgi:hypothetical protein